MTSNGIRTSVALVTMNGPDRLQRCLESLRAQSLQPFEVLVSDDSSTPEFAEATRQMAARFDCRYIRGPRRGLYANRNHAALACTGSHIRTMDDDHTFPAGHWELCEEAVQRDPQAFWSTGEVCFIDGRPWVSGETANQLHPSGVGCSPQDKDNNWAVADGSTIYPASLFRAGKRMVEEFGYGSSYLEFGAYLYQQGYRGRCIPGAQVLHHAGVETLHRNGLPIIESRLFASLACNLYFRRSMALAARYLLVSLLQSKMNPRLIARLPHLLKSVRQRWEGL